MVTTAVRIVNAIVCPPWRRWDAHMPVFEDPTAPMTQVRPSLSTPMSTLGREGGKGGGRGQRDL